MAKRGRIAMTKAVYMLPGTMERLLLIFTNGYKVKEIHPATIKEALVDIKIPLEEQYEFLEFSGESELFDELNDWELERGLWHEALPQYGYNISDIAGLMIMTSFYRVD